MQASVRAHACANTCALNRIQQGYTSLKNFLDSPLYVLYAFLCFSSYDDCLTQMSHLQLCSRSEIISTHFLYLQQYWLYSKLGIFCYIFVWAAGIRKLNATNIYIFYRLCVIRKQELPDHLCRMSSRPSYNSINPLRCGDPCCIATPVQQDSDHEYMIPFDLPTATVLCTYVLIIMRKLHC